MAVKISRVRKYEINIKYDAFSLNLLAVLETTLTFKGSNALQVHFLWDKN